jgi:hypothetical protein
MKSYFSSIIFMIACLSGIAQSQLLSIDYNTRHFIVAKNLSNITLQIRWNGPHLDEPILQNLGPGETLRTETGSWGKSGATYQLQYPEELFIFDSTRIIRFMEKVVETAGIVDASFEVYDLLIEELMPDYRMVYQYDQGGLTGAPTRESTGKGFLQILSGYFNIQAAREMERQMRLATEAMAHAKLLYHAKQKGLEIPELQPIPLANLLENSPNYLWGIPSYGVGYHGDFARVDGRSALLYRGTRTLRVDIGLPLEKVLAARPKGFLFGRLFFTARIGGELANLGNPLGNAQYFVSSSFTTNQGSTEELIPISAGDSLISWDNSLLETGLIWRLKFNGINLDLSMVYPLRWNHRLSFMKQEVMFGGSSVRMTEQTLKGKFSSYNPMPKLGLTFGIGMDAFKTPRFPRKYAPGYMNLGLSYDLAGYRLSDDFPLWYTTGTAAQPEIIPMPQVSPFQRFQFSFSIIQFLPWD